MHMHMPLAQFLDEYYNVYGYEVKAIKKWL